MGRCTATRGQRRIGRTIRKLENGVELSSKEGTAKLSEQDFKRKIQTAQGYTDDSPVQKIGSQPKRQNETSNQ